MCARMCWFTWTRKSVDPQLRNCVEMYVDNVMPRTHVLPSEMPKVAAKGSVLHALRNARMNMHRLNIKK